MPGTEKAKEKEGNVKRQRHSASGARTLAATCKGNRGY